MSALNWFDAVKYQQLSQEGYVVTACRTGATWHFDAFAPEARPTLSYWKWWDSANMREHYPLGARIPQRAEHLGVRATAAEARTLCEAHHAATGPSIDNQSRRARTC